MRTLLLAALMASATVSPAFAQRDGNSEFVADAAERLTDARADAQSVNAQTQMAQRSERGLNRQQDGDGGNWRNRERADVPQAQVQSQPQAQPVERQQVQSQPRFEPPVRAQVRARDDRMNRGDRMPRGDGGNGGGWRGNQGDGVATAQPAIPSQVAQRGDGNWQGRRGDGGGDWQGRRGNGGGDWQGRRGNGGGDWQNRRNGGGNWQGRDRGNGDWRGNRDGNRGGGQVVPVPVPGGTFDRNGNGRVDRDWDRNRNGVVDRRFDRNRDNALDRNWDRNRNGVIDRRFDRNRDGRVDPRFGRDNRDWRGNDRFGNNSRYNDWNSSWNRGWRNDRRYNWNGYRNQNRNFFRSERYIHPYGNRFGYSRFGIGIFLDQLFFSQSYWINDPFDYRLPPAPYGARWVRYYGDVLLVDIRSGYVIDVIHDFFW